jgi:hypothetical protein
VLLLPQTLRRVTLVALLLSVFLRQSDHTRPCRTGDVAYAAYAAYVTDAYVADAVVVDDDECKHF